MPLPPIYLFTDFGMAGPWLGQMHAAIREQTPDAVVINLVADAPLSDPRLSAYLLAACARDLADPAVFACVVDPGVGSERRALIVEQGRRVFVGPDNGLLSRVAGAGAQVREVTWRPGRISDSFHGRDLFAPVAARLAAGHPPEARPIEAGAILGSDWPDSLACVVYVDHFGNAMTGLQAAGADPERSLLAGGEVIRHARTFSEAARGAAFWYGNSLGLVEIAVNRGRAAEQLEMGPGSPVSWQPR